MNAFTSNVFTYVLMTYASTQLSFSTDIKKILKSSRIAIKKAMVVLN